MPVVMSGSDRRYSTDKIIVLSININSKHSRIPDLRLSQKFFAGFRCCGVCLVVYDCSDTVTIEDERSMTTHSTTRRRIT